MTLVVPAYTTACHVRQHVPSPQVSSVYHQRLREQEQEREEKLTAVLNSCVPDQVARLARAVWDRIKGNVPGILRVPLLDLREEGGVLLTWEQGVHHLDVEIASDGSLDFFYLNRETNEAWDVEASLEKRIPEKVLQQFNYFRVVA